MAKKLTVGDLAPDFTLPANPGGQVTLSEVLRDRAVVLYFYPKDNSPGCTVEAKTFRDQYEVFKQEGVEVIGVSADDHDSHCRFADKHSLPFILASDEKGKVRKSYGVPSYLGVLPSRMTFVISKDGRIRNVFSSQIRMKAHVDEALRIIRFLGETAPVEEN